MTYTMVWEHQAMTEFRRLRLIDPIGAKNCRVAVRALADDPHPPAARALGGSGYYRMPVGDWRVLYRLEGDTVSVFVTKVGRVTR
ncbi:type II toxin-antitoxin system RelE family toxin [Streptomyces corynorhini]|uniref:Type II toxin-antitoxin system RelE/ParE family toxin n=1 Tax=Streptomyces corynorhini TaxID=2282652 RepID=A0A370AYN7_9ACTN|nr:type II toxin-antitoxin system RelE/ParE family toxin [Streptomyces corynorhini]RDG33239.1 type II toxin-antitoxin system RelE/ParE family toxin [Streptomyces corynorhini]